MIKERYKGDIANQSVRAKKARNHEEGADDQLHLALVMSISKQEQLQTKKVMPLVLN